MLDKTYEAKPVEAKWGTAWKASKLFHQDAEGGRDPFVVVIPPPNVTGALHIGHALNNSLQDLFVRYRRLSGRTACWVPGTDHGGIATQNVMEKQLKAEGKSRHQLGREAFLERMQEWTRQCKSTILGQLERLGCALDWEREAFTMDEARAKSVFAAFQGLWEKGLVYRGERMVNWCVRCGTALSDIEVEFEDRKGKLWHIRYPEAGKGPESGLVVATTRPETMLGDTAVAVNPKDPRYKSLVGRKLELPLVGREIPVVADDHVESTFGTGAVKTTPAHDPADFEIWQRHPQEVGKPIKVISPDGHIINAPGYDGLSREKAREKVVADLTERGLLVKTEDHPHGVGCCYRCGSAIEPLLSWQWFVKMRPIADLALKASEEGKFTLHPASWTAPYRKWLADIKDWCVSRQIWWGHRIPVWYCVKCSELGAGDFHQKPDLKGVVSQDKPASPCAGCGGSDWVQDPDVLDTWFSSALWPLSVFGWPDKTKDLAFFYPTSVLVTGYEILYLWVARMQMMGLLFHGRVPFHDAVIHGIVRDKSGKKMSKSLGNVVDPLTMMDKYGTDAFRFSLLAQAHPGKDIPFAEDSITGARNFANKLWNSTRFVLMNLPEKVERPYSLGGLTPESLELADRWILSRYSSTITLVREKLDAWEPAAAADAVYGFLWDEYCAWYVELAKARLEGPDGPSKEAARAILVQVLSGTLKLLHPFMPFITEELFAALKPWSGETARYLLDAGLPAGDPRRADEAAVREMSSAMEAVSALRSLRSQLNVPPAERITVVSSEPVRHEGYVRTLARVGDFKVDSARPAQSATAVAGGRSLFVPLQGLIDFGKERARLEKELQKAQSDLGKIEQKVGNKAFLDRAPEAEVALARQQKAAALERIERLRETLAALS